MNVYQILDEIISINPNNEFIQYITIRLKSPNYRGIHISQHNRYDLNYIINLLNIIYQTVGDKVFEIPAGDYSERTGKKDYNINDYPEYKKIVDEIKTITHKGSYNSVKKNFFVDLERMGLLNRSKDKRYASLTQEAINLIKFFNSGDVRKLTKKFTDLIDENLFGNFLSELVEFMWLYGYEKIDIYEFMLVLSDDSITDTYKDILLKDYRILTKHQKNKILSLIKQFANPKNFTGNKTEKRDFHNWINESQQIFSLIKFTTYFLVVTENGVLKLILNTSNETGIFSIDELKRSQTIKRKYFELHKVPKFPDFELHHIVPIKVALNKKDMKEIDNEFNLIYTHKDAHKEIHKNNTYRIKSINESILILDNIKNSNVLNLCNDKNVCFSKDNKIINDMEKYNKRLVEKYIDNILQIS